MRRYYPRIDGLVRVIPVAQSQTQDDTVLTFLSVDCYSGGWIANLRVYRSDPQGYPLFMFYPKRHPRPAIQYVGSGPSTPYTEGDANWYLSYAFQPALDPDEPPLEFDVPVMRFTDRPRTEGGALVAEVPGPWHFVVPVSEGAAAKEVLSVGERWQPSNGKQRAERQRETMPIYGQLFDDVLDIFYRYDPIIGWLDPSGAEWYVSVTYLILDRLPDARSAEDVRIIALDEFRKRWKTTFHEEGQRFNEIGVLIWEAWQRRHAETQTTG